MRFGPVPVGEAAGAVAAHAVQAQGPDGEAVVLRKGEAISAGQAAALARAGLRTVVVARLEPGDIGEDAAARRLAEAAAGSGLSVDRAFTGRANLFAAAPGVLLVDAEAVDRVNAVDERLTLATLPPFRAVGEGEMVATVKVIPFALEEAVVGRALAALPAPPLGLAPYRARRIGVVSTMLPGLKPSVVAKTLRVLDGRLGPTGSRVLAEERVPHETAALASTLARLAPAHDLLIVYGASAIADRRDVVPAAVERAGGAVEHLGMPVDPGNLLMLGRVGATPVLGAPGCARSPKENGFDWVLRRLLADVPLRPADLGRLGVGGLLMEITTRPQPRDAATEEGAREEGS